MDKMEKNFLKSNYWNVAQHNVIPLVSQWQLKSLRVSRVSNSPDPTKVFTKLEEHQVSAGFNRTNEGSRWRYICRENIQQNIPPFRVI